MKRKLSPLIISILVLTSLIGCSQNNTNINTNIVTNTQNSNEKLSNNKVIIENSNNDVAWYEVNNNIPLFTEEEKKSLEPFEVYSNLDDLGRCGVAYANVCKELMPIEERGEIGQIKPTGWHTIKYDCVDGKYLYNRCHLIGFQLTGENANEKNLITGTRYLNIQGMLDFENEIAEYVKKTNNHVLYRVTPEFYEDNLLCNGVYMEAYSIEDNGEGVQFYVFARNIQPNIIIDYKTGDSWLNENHSNIEENTLKNNKNISNNEEKVDVIINLNTKKYHKSNCNSVLKISENNKETYNGTISWLNENGYEPCKNCFK